jgi:beta-phosphoglucomutase
MNKIEAVLFDLDGVLVDACDWHYDALNMALKNEIGFEIDRNTHLEKYNGLPTKVKLKMLGLSEQQSTKIEDLKQKFTIELIDKNAKVDETKIELLWFIKSTGAKISCVTNSIKMTANLMLEKTGIFQYFDLLIANGDVRNNKPYPDGYNLAISTLAVNPQYCICVEDSPKGLEAARSSNAKYVWEVKTTIEVNKQNYLRFIDEYFDTNGR